MARSDNAEIAVKMYQQMLTAAGWGVQDCWKAIAKILLTCEVYQGGAWSPFHGCVVYAERNVFSINKNGQQNAALRNAELLSDAIAYAIGVHRNSLCSTIAAYWRDNKVKNVQPHNLVGHAFRSIIVETLARFGDSSLTFEEEVAPHVEFPGYRFANRSRNARIDIIARRGSLPVAIISTRWRFRHDRVDVIDEAQTYLPAARKINPSCQFYAVVGEFMWSRLDKILAHVSAKVSNPSIAACVHMVPHLLPLANPAAPLGDLKLIKGLDWFAQQTHGWK